MPANFDRVARPYRILERLTLGHALERTREHFLPQLLQAQRALVIGDGDGRFLAQLLTRNPSLKAEAIDTSAAMLTLLQARCHKHSSRLKTQQQNALTFRPAQSYDLIATHFFLDCLTQSQLEQLAANLVPALAPGGLWLVSDFRIPPEGPMRWPARILIRALYLAFRILTGLRVTSLPDHAQALTQAGLTPRSQHLSLGGILTTELWQRQCADS